jgi:hypothetical protein
MAFNVRQLVIFGTIGTSTLIGKDGRYTHRPGWPILDESRMGLWPTHRDVLTTFAIHAR